MSPEVVRAWERRYQLLEPARTEGGFRLYAEDDLARVRRMRELMAGGMSAAEAARAARESGAAPLVAAPPVPVELTDRLRSALASFDEDAAHRAVDDLLAAITLETFLRDVVLALLREIGEAWETKRASVGHEHFATTLLRGRLLGLARGWDRGGGRRAALACMPGELHDVGLIAFGIVLARRGWRVLYLGQDTPLASLEDDARAAHASAVVLSAVGTTTFEAHTRELRALARAVPVAIGGSGATERVAKAIGARLLPADAVAAADLLSTTS